VNLPAMAHAIGGTEYKDDLVQTAHLAQLQRPNTNLKHRMRDAMLGERRWQKRHSVSLDAPVDEGKAVIDLIPASAPTSLDLLLQKERTAKLKHAVRGLNPRQQEFIQLHFYDGLELGEIAQRWNITYGHIKVFKHRTLQELSGFVPHTIK